MKRRRGHLGHLGSDFKGRFCLSGNVTHRDAQLQSGRRDGVAAERRYRSSLLRSHILSDSHVVSRATRFCPKKLEQKNKTKQNRKIQMIQMRSTAEPFDEMVHIKHGLLGALWFSQCTRSTSRLPQEIYENSRRISRTNDCVSATPVYGKAKWDKQMAEVEIKDISVSVLQQVID